MVFSSAVFLFLFLPLTLLLYSVSKKIEKKNTVLILASICFYSWGEPVYIFLLLISIVANWYFGLKVSQSDVNAKKWLIFSILFNLVLIFIFKYLGFVCDNINLLFNLNLKSNIILPIGISFYTFQAISYVVDVYRDRNNVQKSLKNVALYIAFFPQLVAGPIVRYSTIVQQMTERKHDNNEFTYGVRRFILGIGKKVILANNFALIADTIFDSKVVLGGALHWIGAVAYSLQILFDFSGYSDMAIGLGKMFGFDFPENFDYPYISKSVTEFWRRWHISLGTWFRDYVYIPLGGNKVTKYRHIINLFVVWILTGLWHGANWTFIAWGVGYFVVLLVEKFTYLGKWMEKRHFISHVYTLLLVMLGWVIFRSENLHNAILYIKSLFGSFILEGDESLLMEIKGEYLFFFCFALLFVVPWESYVCRFIQQSSKKMESFVVVKDILLFLMFLLSISYIVKGSYNPFIYFNF